MAALLPRIKLTYPSKGMIQLIRAYEMDLHGLLMKVMILSPLLLLDIITLIHELREYLRVLRHGYHFIVGTLFSVLRM